MQVYLIECGQFYILFVQERQEYFIVDDHPGYFQQFMFGDMQCDQWKGGLKFQFEDSEEKILPLFYLPENNPGAVIAARHADDEEPKVYDRYRLSSVNR